MNNDAFKALEEEFHSITNALSRKISSISSTSDRAEVASLTQEAENDIYDANNVVKKMEVEVRHYPYNLKATAQQQITVLRNSLDAQRKDLERAKNKVEPPNLGQRRTGRQERQAHNDQRKMLLEGRDAVVSSEQSMLNTQRTLEETYEVGSTTSTRLLEQREQILRARDAVHETDDVLSRSKRILQRMARRTVTNKLITATIIVLELGAIGLIVYFRFIKDK